jgi:hypothetical protein
MFSGTLESRNLLEIMTLKAKPLEDDHAEEPSRPYANLWQKTREFTQLG